MVGIMMVLVFRNGDDSDDVEVIVMVTAIIVIL